jgi:hypothetical protein
MSFLVREDRFEGFPDDVNRVDAVVLGLAIALIGSAVYAARLAHRASHGQTLRRGSSVVLSAATVIAILTILSPPTAEVDGGPDVLPPPAPARPGT